MALIHLKGWDPSLFQGSPWFFALAPQLAVFTAHSRFPTLAELDALLQVSCEAAGLPSLSTVYSAPKTTHRKKRKVPVDLDTLYDVRISEKNLVPTRENDWHDFFNVLAFAAWPRTKRALHTRQARLLRERIVEGSRRLPGARSREQDALTLLDEGGVIVAADLEAHALLSRCEDDMSEPLATCVQAGKASLVPFGHALFEHMIEGLPCPLAIPQLIPIAPKARALHTLRDTLDRALCDLVSDPHCFLAPTSLKGLALDRYLPAENKGQNLVPCG